jgi:hypothetical protein
MAIVIGGSIAAAGAIGGAAISSSASKDAASTQADSANRAADLQNDQYQQNVENLKPFTDFGKNNIDSLQSLINNPFLTQGFYADKFSAPTAAQAQQTPGYQFTLDQGLKATQNSAAARGLGTSGAALKGASTYATGLADSTYNDVYNRALSAYNTNFNSALSQYNTNQQTLGNQINRLQTAVQTGQNSAAMTAQQGTAAAANAGNYLTSGANAQAAGTVGSANALSGALNSVGSSALTYGLLNNNASTPAATYGAVNTSTPSGYNVGSNQYGFTV